MPYLLSLPVGFESVEAVCQARQLGNHVEPADAAREELVEFARDGPCRFQTPIQKLMLLLVHVVVAETEIHHKQSCDTQCDKERVFSA
jgi:hypothetical protein